MWKAKADHTPHSRRLIIKTTRANPDDTNVRVLKTGLCPSLSGKSKLTFEVGCDQAAAIYVRISKNSGSGWFSKDWVALTSVHGLFEKSAGRPITFSTLLPVFKGQSVNTAGFLLAILKHEGLVQPMADNARCYERAPAKAFFAEVERLIAPLER